MCGEISTYDDPFDEDFWFVQERIEMPSGKALYRTFYLPKGEYHSGTVAGQKMAIWGCLGCIEKLMYWGDE